MTIARAIGAGRFDPYWGNVSLLLSMDGNSGSTTFVDLSKSKNSVSASGGAQVSTACSKFDGGSASFGTGSDYLTVSASTPSTGDWTIECFFQKNTAWLDTNTRRRIIGAVTTNGLEIFINGYEKTLRLGKSGVGPLLDYSFSTLSIDVWHHLAWVHASGQYQLFINGSSVASNTYALEASSTTSFKVGGNTNEGCNGYIDELRITNGVARYTGTFAAPSMPFPRK